MTSPLVIALPGNMSFAGRLAAALGTEAVAIEYRQFPDGESYVRLPCEVEGRNVVLVCTLAGPDTRFLPLVFAADTARDLGAASIGLVAPYLAYMRQDMRFLPGEAISSRSFARLLSGSIDWLVTVDPHLHRYASLDALYAVPAQAVSAAAPLADWICRHVEAPLIIGPDSESEQWAARIAALAGAPHAILGKTRSGDRKVHIRLPDLRAHKGRKPVLVDDIVSSGGTVLEAARLLQQAGFERPACAIVHALFAQGAFDAVSATLSPVVTSDTVEHPSNAVSMAPLVASAVAVMLADRFAG